MIDIFYSYQERLQQLGARAKQLRRRKKFNQDELALHAGIGVATVRRFEKTGSASIENILRIAFALNAEAPFEKLFDLPPFASIDEALNDSPTKLTEKTKLPKKLVKSTFAF